MDPRRPLDALRRVRARLLGDPVGLGIAATGIVGLLAYRSALGRSDFHHLEAVMGPAVALLCVGIDGCAGLWAAGRGRRALAAWRTLALAFFAWQSAYLVASGAWPQPTPWEAIRLARTTPAQEGSPRALRVVDYVLRNTRPEDPVLFLPSNPSYYYLTGRRNPTRFAQAHQIVTDAHRREALDGLRRHPPRLIVHDLGIWLVDEIPLRRLLGSEILQWIHENYRVVETSDRIAILERRDAAEPGR